MDVKLIRLEESEITIGVLLLNGAMECFVAEPPWRDNRPSVSCVPEGIYTCIRRYSHKVDGDTFELVDVPGRENIIIHWGNTIEDTEGCLLTGTVVGYLSPDKRRASMTPVDGYRRAVLRSKAAFRRFMGRMNDVNEFKLNITRPSEVLWCRKCPTSPFCDPDNCKWEVKDLLENLVRLQNRVKASMEQCDQIIEALVRILEED